MREASKVAHRNHDLWPQRKLTLPLHHSSLSITVTLLVGIRSGIVCIVHYLSGIHCDSDAGWTQHLLIGENCGEVGHRVSDLMPQRKLTLPLHHSSLSIHSLYPTLQKVAAE